MGPRERARAALISSDGVQHTGDGRSERIAETVVVVVTNARVMFVAPDEEMDLQEWSVYYGEMKEVSIDRSKNNKLMVVSKEGDIWEGALPNADSEMLDAVIRHFDWVSHIRQDLLALEAAVDEAAVEIRDKADEMEWKAGREIYSDLRDDLDELIVDIQLTLPMADETIAPELTDIERALEEANSRLYLECARAYTKSGKALVEQQEYRRATDALDRAIALQRRAEGQNDVVKRGDSFEFGRQRVLGDDIERLEWKMETVAAEPVHQAEQAKRLAEQVPDPSAALDHWEDAVDRFTKILELDWWEKAQPIADDIAADAEEQRQEAIRGLIDSRIDLGERHWDAATDSEDSSDARAHYEAAVTHYERALELAQDSDYIDPESIQRNLEEIHFKQALELSGEQQSGGVSVLGGDEEDESAPGEQMSSEIDTTTDGPDSVARSDESAKSGQGPSSGDALSTGGGGDGTSDLDPEDLDPVELFSTDDLEIDMAVDMDIEVDEQKRLSGNK